MNRRAALAGLGGSLIATSLPLPGMATEQEVSDAIRALFGDRPLRRGHVSLKLPGLAEFGNSVPVSVSVEAPRPEVRVLRVGLYSNQNPRPLIATVTFGPRAGRTTFATNVRLSGTQDVIAVAEMSDGVLWTHRAHILVTIGACDALQTRF